MVIKTFTLKSILIIFNSLNISTAIVHIIITLITFNHEGKADSMLMNYLTMIMSAICCAAAVMESPCILQITANIFLSKVVVTIVLWVYKISSTLTLYTFFAMILHIKITFLAYYMTQRIQMNKLNNLIATYTGTAAMRLTPPPHVRADVI